MGTKIWIVVLFIVLIFFWYYFTTNCNEEISSPVDYLESITNSQIKGDEKQTAKIKNKKLIKKPVGKEGDGIKLLPGVEPVYDVDPVVNASMLLKANTLCMRYLSDNDKYKEYMGRFKNKLDTNQQKFHDNFSKHCQQLNKDHPEYHLTDTKFLKQQKTSSEATSLWGRILKSEILVEDLTESEIRGLLKSNDLNILTQAQKHLSEYYQKVIHWDLESVLQNHQYDYVAYIQNYAHQLYLCQLGADCSPHSSTMVMLCYLNSKGCGLNYHDYIQQVLTQGQQADVALALDYLKSQYQ